MILNPPQKKKKKLERHFIHNLDKSCREYYTLKSLNGSHSFPLVEVVCHLAYNILANSARTITKTSMQPSLFFKNKIK